MSHQAKWRKRSKSGEPYHKTTLTDCVYENYTFLLRLYWLVLTNTKNILSLINKDPKSYFEEGNGEKRISES